MQTALTEVNMEITGILTVVCILMSFCSAVSGNNVELNISSTIFAGETVSGKCVFIGAKKHLLYIRVQGKPSSCLVDGGNVVGKEELQSSNYTSTFNITCSKSNINFHMKCFTNTRTRKNKTIKVISKPKIVNPPVNVTVARPGLSITLSCQVDGDPNHYWIGWFYKTSIIKNEDDDHSVSVSPNFRSQQGGTTHHLTVHSVKHDSKYQCLVYTIRDGSVIDQLTHQVTVINEERTDQSSSLLDMILRL